MSGNIKFRWFLLAPIVLALLVVVTTPIISCAEMNGEALKIKKKAEQEGSSSQLIGKGSVRSDFILRLELIHFSTIW